MELLVEEYEPVGQPQQQEYVALAPANNLAPARISGKSSSVNVLMCLCFIQSLLSPSLCVDGILVAATDERITRAKILPEHVTRGLE